MLLKDIAAGALVAATHASRHLLRPLAGEIAVLAPSSAGSMGDQAMAEAVRAELSARGFRPLFVYLTDWTPIMLDGSARNLVLSVSPRRRELQEALIAARSSAVLMIGADVLDGVYDPERVLERLRILDAAAGSGVPTAVLGFSFSTTPAPAVVDYLRKPSRVRLFTRDPVSGTRLLDATGRTPENVADLAFLLRPKVDSASAREAARWISERRAGGGLVLGVNASGHTLEKMPGGEGVYAETLRRWLDVDPARSAILLPHDVRQRIGDVEPLRRIRSALAGMDDRIFFLEPPFSAWDLKAVAGMTDAVLTGRMHLAIAALGMGVPPLSIVYQGKFEGLMQHLDLEGLTVDPASIEGADGLLQPLERLLAARDHLRAQIARRLPAVHELARANLDWLPVRP